MNELKRFDKTIGINTAPVKTELSKAVASGAIFDNNHTPAVVSTTLFRHVKGQNFEQSLSTLFIHINDKGIATLMRTVPFAVQSKSSNSSAVYSTPVHLLVGVDPDIVETERETGRDQFYINNAIPFKVDLALQSKITTILVTGTLSTSYIVNDYHKATAVEGGQTMSKLAKWNNMVLAVFKSLQKYTDEEVYTTKQERLEGQQEVWNRYQTSLNSAIQSGFFVESAVIYPEMLDPCLVMNLTDTTNPIDALNPTFVTQQVSTKYDPQHSFNALEVVLGSTEGDVGNIVVGIENTYASKDSRIAYDFMPDTDQTVTRHAEVKALNGASVPVLVRVYDRRMSGSGVVKRSERFFNIASNTTISVQNASLEFRRVAEGTNAVIPLIGANNNRPLQYKVDNSSVSTVVAVDSFVASDVVEELNFFDEPSNEQQDENALNHLGTSIQSTESNDTPAFDF